jgi:hypothetical protein
LTCVNHGGIAYAVKVIAAPSSKACSDTLPLHARLLTHARLRTQARLA